MFLLIPCCYGLFRRQIWQFKYYTFLHHSQTLLLHWLRDIGFEYYTFLHHSQTNLNAEMGRAKFEYYTFLHHSQT